MEHSHVMLWAVPLVALLGYASHRASLCTVRAVADILEDRRFERFGGFARAVLWTMLLTLPAICFFPERFPVPTGAGPLWGGLLGGFFFGLGAAVNIGCAFSTLQRLADADWRMLATLIGFVGGGILLELLPSVAVTSASMPVSTHPDIGWLIVGLAALSLWAVRESVALWRRRITPRHLFQGTPFSPAATAAFLGLGAGMLYLGFGSWTYTDSLQRTAGALVGNQGFPSLFQLALIPSLLGGMLLSAWQRGSWRTRKPGHGWATHLFGGILMGSAGTLIPGGNDTLLLKSNPSLAPGSLWIYFMLVAGVALGLLLERYASPRLASRCGAAGDRDRCD